MLESLIDVWMERRQELQPLARTYGFRDAEFFFLALTQPWDALRMYAIVNDPKYIEIDRKAGWRCLDLLGMAPSSPIKRLNGQWQEGVITGMEYLAKSIDLFADGRDRADDAVART